MPLCDEPEPASTPSLLATHVEPRDDAYRNWIFTIPNVICMVRLLGSIVLLVLALIGLRYWFVSLFVALTLSDWIDGRIARWLHQRSDFGARLDSFADAALYTALLVGTAILCWDAFQAEYVWVAVAVGSYFLTTLTGLIKYHRIPSYHTWAAKKSQALVLLAGVALVLGWAVWPLRLAALAVTITNIEATLMTLVLPRWHADVPSLWTAVRSDRLRG